MKLIIPSVIYTIGISLLSARFAHAQGPAKSTAKANAAKVVAAQSQVNPATEAKITAVIAKMTLEEKIAMLHGNALFSSAGVERLGIPELTCDDGPLGVRDEVQRFDWKSANWTTDSATFFPNGSAMAATWNPEMARKYGVALGEEANARKKKYHAGTSLQYLPDAAVRPHLRILF